MTRRNLFGIVVAAMLLSGAAIASILYRGQHNSGKPPMYTYNVINVYPHDEDAFTEGLVFNDGFIYESTGIYGQSSLRRVELQTGRILQLYSLPENLFGEGITILDDKIIQLTWQSKRGFVYDKNTFELLGEFSYPTEGWGITHNGSHLIMSDGTSTLYLLDPETFEEVGRINVYDEGPVTELNELEYVKGEILANVWKKSLIARINPVTGHVTGWIDLNAIENFEKQDLDDVLNGIAYDAKNDLIFITGKRWPRLFEIKIVLA